jgi:hypothetical protein
MVEKQEPPTERSGALRDAPALIYVLGGFPPRGAPLADDDAICILDRMPDYCKRYDLAEIDLIGKGSCPISLTQPGQ